MLRTDCAAQVIFVVKEFVQYIIFVEYFDVVFFCLRVFVERYDLFGTGLNFGSGGKLTQAQVSYQWVPKFGPWLGVIHGSWMASCSHNSRTVLGGVRDFPLWTRKSVN